MSTPAELVISHLESMFLKFGKIDLDKREVKKYANLKDIGEDKSYLDMVQLNDDLEAADSDEDRKLILKAWNLANKVTLADWKATCLAHVEGRQFAGEVPMALAKFHTYSQAMKAIAATVGKNSTTTGAVAGGKDKGPDVSSRLAPKSPVRVESSRLPTTAAHTEAELMKLTVAQLRARLEEHGTDLGKAYVKKEDLVKAALLANI